MRSLLFVVLVLFQLGYAQDEKYFDSPFGMGGGFTPGWFIPNFDAVNNNLASFGTSELSNSGFFATGGSGFVYIGFIPNLRVGGMGIGGSTTQTGVKDGYKREVVYSSGFGGLTVEYTLPFVRDFGISVGAIIGGGGTTIEIYRNKGTFNWNDIWNEAGNSLNNTGNISRKLHNYYFMFAPTLNIDIPVYRIFAFRVGAGYSLTFNKNWTVDNDNDLFNVPSDLSSNQFFIQTGIFVGFFSY
ncbi:MAG TPA: hypothetical protein PK397_13025 [Ignavibacteriaceae bacterium]|jgi:hypothetical protein|nr:hypothetical protein [Ignavibacteriaceae bacterium]